ncbi:hypothetical protein L249_6485 [Ophiocordyceps polyrhachis-furcata BCC 54312]|uniref:Uncharacterized protein n=1 Tax=Ophiocordyceps polyrhachis-furcata BCC 54312 TaxID=1330021 RepID=A0A367LLM5_9HYPO|nr:hypothetical protein L249_6485 [Ophiocordyceps polyrhachis-furcata BCC 54312]
MPHASSAGSTVFCLSALLVISFGVLLILRHYLPLRSTPAFYLVPIFFALWLPSIAVILVPVDLASSAATDDAATRGIRLPQRAILVSWRITYWLTFALTWFILPILAEFSDAGYRDPDDKLRYSLRQNAQFYAIFVLAGLAGFVYTAVVYSLDFASLKAFVMAASYCWGLVFAIYLMGHGLVSIPRRLIRGASISGNLRRLQGRAVKLHEQMEDSLVALEEVEEEVLEVRRRKVGSCVEFQDWIEELASLTANRRPATVDETHTRSLVPVVMTQRYLADLTRRFTRARHARCRYVDEWTCLKREATESQAILNSAASQSLDFGGAASNVLTPYTRYLYHYHVAPCMRLVLGGLLAVASICILWSELIRFAFPKLSMIRLSVIHHWVGGKAQVGFAGQTISCLYICYMCAAALVSVTEVKAWRGRALVKRNTAYESAFWYSTQVAKLCIPLSYNYVTFLTPEVYQKTTFYRFLGEQIESTAPGRWFDDLFPIILLFPVLATLFGLYGRVKRFLFGIGMVSYDGDDGGGDDDNPSSYGRREGQRLLEQDADGEAAFRRRRDVTTTGLSANNNSNSNNNNNNNNIVSAPPTRDDTSLRPAVTSPRPRLPPRGQFSNTEPEDDNILQILGHRMKNTIDTMETPRWLQEIGQGIKNTKWVGEDGELFPTDGRGGDVDFRRWFGGGGDGGGRGGGGGGGGGAGGGRIRL